MLIFCLSFAAPSDPSANLTTCCDPVQVTSLVTQLAFGQGLLQRCPSCVRNFRQTFCYMTCSPNQAEFMVAKKVQTAQDTSKYG